MTRIERWWWLALFCFVSLGLHVLVGLNSRSFRMEIPATKPAEIEVALEPLPEEKKVVKPEPKEKPAPKPKVVAEQKPDRKPSPNPAPRQRTVAVKAPTTPKPAPVRIAKITEPRPEAKIPDPGGVDQLKNEKPLPQGMPVPATETRIKAAQPAVPTAEKTPAPSQTPAPAAEALPDSSDTAFHVSPAIVPRAAPNNPLSSANPLAGLGAPDENPSAPAKSPDSAALHLKRVAQADPNLSGGGSPAPSMVPGGHGGAPGPQAPPEDLLFNGGGAGGAHLPKAAPRLGGGGGRSILSVNNPLAKDAIPEDKPGLGPGIGGGQGTGTGGGIGLSRGRGIGTNPNGRYPVASLHSGNGPGIGAGQGSGVGSRSPGGGRGTGAELPGTGGSGFGYGSGNGNGVGSGFRPGVGSIAHVGSSGGGAGGGGSGGPRVAVSRGVPFGDIAGLLRGDPKGGSGSGGGPGGSGRGIGGGGGTPGGGDGPVHIVYLLDVSGSMRRGNKIGKARAALKSAIAELKPGDTFNIIAFDAEYHPFADTMQRVSPAVLQQANEYVDQIQLDVNPGTNISGVLQEALSLQNISQIYLMSDGEPNGGIRNFDELRAMVRELNTQKARISTYALGLGEHFRGIDLLKGIADDNQGSFGYVNLSKATSDAR